MRLLSDKAIDQWLRIMFRICAGLCCTPMHAIPSDLLLDVDNAQLLLAKYFDVDLFLARLVLAPLANSRSRAVWAAFTANIQYFCASIWNPERSVKFANVHVGTIHHISLQFSYQFAIFTPVCNSHILVYSFYVDVCHFHMGLQFSYEFALFISVCNSHVMSQLQPFLCDFAWIPCHCDLELINSTSWVLCGRQI